MNYKILSLGLGIFSVALGGVGLLASRRITGVLKADGHEAVVKAFGAREMLAGANLIAAPAHATNMWIRVAGDAIDLATLGLTARSSPRNRAVWSALAFIAVTTVIDVIAARGLDRQTGKTTPARAMLA